jgi:hypothetical protein
MIRLMRAGLQSDDEPPEMKRGERSSRETVRGKRRLHLY